MKKLLAAAVLGALSLMPIGCGKVYNSSSFDPSIYGTSGGGTTGSTTFLAAKTIINENCATCHTHPSHQAWAGMGEADFIAQGLVTPGSLTGSMIYTKIQGNRTGIAGNMPDGGTLLTGAQLDTMEAWITGIH
jgi:hypothetical protein